MAKKKISDTPVVVPKVRITAPAGRPLQVRYWCNKQRREIRLSVGSRDIVDAEKLKARVEAKLLLGIEVEVGKKQVCGPDMDIEAFLNEYSRHHLGTLRDKTAKDAGSRLDIAIRILKPKTLGDLAKPDALLRLQTSLLEGEESRRKEPRSVFTVRGHMKSVLAALNWAHYQNWLPTQPRGPKLKAPKLSAMKGRPITEAEFNLMLAAVPEVVGERASESWKRVLRGLWESALRIEELMNVSWDEEGAIVPRWNDGQFPVLDIPAAMQKNDSDQTIPLLPAFEEILLETPEDQRKGWVFNPESLPLRFGGEPKCPRLKVGWVGKVISRIGKKANIKVGSEKNKKGAVVKFASAHDLRRSCAQRLRDAGVPPLIICRIMRHSSWETTRKYYAAGTVQSEAETLKSFLEKKAPPVKPRRPRRKPRPN